MELLQLKGMKKANLRDFTKGKMTVEKVVNAGINVDRKNGKCGKTARTDINVRDKKRNKKYESG